MKKYISLLRIKHYIKNILIFIPLIFNESLFEPKKLSDVILGFISFSFASSVVYIINDIRDCEKDRKHPKKCKRPIASGAISIKRAVIIAIILSILSIAITLCGENVWESILCILIYVIINIAYSIGMKNIPIVDIVILTSGYIIRVLFGAVIIDVNISGWLYLTVISAAFYLGLGKRRNELKNSENLGETRAVLKYYTYSFLDRNMYVFMALTDAFYALWTMSRQNTYLIWTSPLVMIILMKYSLDIEGDYDGDPVDVLLNDKAIIVLALIYVVSVLLLIYLI